MTAWHQAVNANDASRRATGVTSAVAVKPTEREARPSLYFLAVLCARVR